MTNGYKPFISSLIVFILIFPLIQSSPPDNEFEDIYKAARAGKIDIKLTALGGHSDSCMLMEIENLSNTPIKLVSPAGLRLNSDNENEQDILVVKESKFRVGAFSKIRAKVFGFCCQSSNSSPKKGSTFKLGGMAIAPLAKIARYISKRDLKSRDMQRAIWSISDDHSIGSLRRDDRDSYNLLVTVAKIKGVEVPWYTVQYVANSDTLSAFAKRHNTLQGRFKYSVPNQCVISLLVLNENGHVVKILQRGKLRSAGEHKQMVNMMVNDLPKGKYSLVIKTSDNRFIQKRSFEL